MKKKHWPTNCPSGSPACYTLPPAWVADAKLDTVLAASGGTCQAVAKDSACQFTAVAVQVSGWTTSTLRAMVVGMLEGDDLSTELIAVVDGSRTPAEYLARPDRWGDWP